MSLLPLTYRNLKDAIGVATNCGGHVVLVTTRHDYWRSDLDRHVPAEMEEHVSIASPEDIAEYGFPMPLSDVLIDGRVPRTALLRLQEAMFDLKDGSPIDRPEFVIDESELPY